MTFPILGALENPDVQDFAAFRQAVDALYALKEQSFAQADAETIVTRFYTEDAITVGPSGKVVKGREAFRGMYERMVQDKTVKIESWNSHVSGNVGWDWTNFHVYPNDPASAPSCFIILFLWNKGPQGWQCAGDMFLSGEGA